jgi:hypothetical protein
MSTGGLCLIASARDDSAQVVLWIKRERLRFLR